MPVPVCKQSQDATFQQVWRRLQRRTSLGWMIGSTAVFACVVGTVSSLMPGNTSRLQLTQQTIQPTVVKIKPVAPISSLKVALNNPVIDIPKTAVAVPEQEVKPSQNLDEGTGLDVN